MIYRFRWSPMVSPWWTLKLVNFGLSPQFNLHFSNWSFNAAYFQYKSTKCQCLYGHIMSCDLPGIEEEQVLRNVIEQNINIMWVKSGICINTYCDITGVAIINLMTLSRFLHHPYRYSCRMKFYKHKRCAKSDLKSTFLENHVPYIKSNQIINICY